MLILVTRPQPQADQWVDALRGLGEQAQALPLIDIGAPATPAAVQQAWRDLSQTRLVIFVSPNAAMWFARLRPADGRWPEHTLAACPGPGTARVVRDTLACAGLTDGQLIAPPSDSAQFDSEHLWPLLAPLSWSSERAIIISGGDQGEAKGRTWLSEQLQAQGASVSPVLTYQRQAACWSVGQVQCAREAFAAPDSHLWLLSSSEAIGHLQTLAGPIPQGAQALATHPKVAERARSAGFERVYICQPTPQAVAQARRTLLPV